VGVYSVKETTIAFVIYFSTIFLLIQIKLIGRIRKLRIIRRKMIESEYSLKSIGDICYCISCCCTGDIGNCSREAYDLVEEEDKGSFEFRHKARMEKRYKERKQRHSSLDLRLEKEKSKIIKLIQDSEKTSIWWVNSYTSVPKEDIVEILKYEPGYLIVDDYIYNERKMTKEEILEVKEKIIGWKMCPDCENPVEPESEFCPNCGHDLSK